MYIQIMYETPFIMLQFANITVMQNFQVIFCNLWIMGIIHKNLYFGVIVMCIVNIL
jgi:hypothetical protein